MDAKHFNMLAIAAAVSLVTAGIVHSAYDTWTAEKVEGERLFPDFDNDAASITRVTLTKGKETFTFDKNKSGNWSFTERGGYPVDGKKVRELLVKIARAELVEAKTRDPKRYNLLELGDPKKKDAKASFVRLSNAADKTIAELIVGKRRASAFGAGKSGSYVRRPGNPQTWLTNTVIRVPFDVSDWVKPVFFQMPLDKVRSVQLTPPDGAPVTLVLEAAPQSATKANAKDKKTANKTKKNELKPEPKFKFAAVPEGKKAKKGVDATVMVKALETLEMTDVRKAAEAKVPKNAVRIPAIVETQDGLKLEAAVLKIGENDRWVSFKVLQDGKDKKFARQLKEKLAGWQFKIADWRSRQIFKTAAEMFENKPAEEPAIKTPETDGRTPPLSPLPKQ